MVREYPLLWDTTIEEYRRTDLKKMHWDQIAQALGPKFTGDIVCKRFQNMESTFRANERRVKESKARCSGKGTDEMYKPKWEYYDMLLFLKKRCAQSDSIDNLFSQNHMSLSSQETVNHSPVSHISSNVQKTPQLTNIYYDRNTEQYMLIPSEICDYNNTASTSGQTSPSVESYISELSPASTVTSASQSLATSASQAVDDTSDLSLQEDTSSRSILTPLNKRPAENSLYVKRGSSKKKTKLMEDAVNAIKTMAQENVSFPKMDTFDMLGSYIASRLRSMTQNDQEYYEREILKVLSLHYKQ